MINSLDIAIDFDGTCVINKFPKIGADVGAAPILKALVNKNHNLILCTTRTGNDLKEAVEWFKNNNIDLYAIQSPIHIEVEPDMYIDDKAIGTPLIHRKNEHSFVDWMSIAEILFKREIL